MSAVAQPFVVPAPVAAEGDSTESGHLANLIQILKSDPEVSPEGVRLGFSEVAAAIARAEKALEFAQAREFELLQSRRLVDRLKRELRTEISFRRAPIPRGIQRVPVRDDKNTLVDTLFIVMSDGTLKQYWPHFPKGKRWTEHEPVPTTRAAIQVAEGYEPK